MRTKVTKGIAGRCKLQELPTTGGTGISRSTGTECSVSIQGSTHARHHACMLVGAGGLGTHVQRCTTVPLCRAVYHEHAVNRAGATSFHNTATTVVFDVHFTMPRKDTSFSKHHTCNAI
jgi:hypothetical protein